MVAYLPKYSKYLSYFYPILKILQKLKILNFINEAFLNISAKRDIPLTKMNYFKDNELASELDKNMTNPVIVFPDSFKGKNWWLWKGTSRLIILEYLKTLSIRIKQLGNNTINFLSGGVTS